MTTTHPIRSTLFVWVVLASVGCGASSSPTAPSTRTFDVNGWTWEVMPPVVAGNQPVTPLDGVRIEVLTGPSTGLTTTSVGGRFALGKMPSGTYQVRASMDGYQPVTRTVTVSDDALVAVIGTPIYVHIGKAPHTLHGIIFNSRGGRVPYARVEIIGGANAGLVTQATIEGQYRFDGLATSGPFEVRATHADFDGRTVPFTNAATSEPDLIGLVHHQALTVLLTPKSGT